MSESYKNDRKERELGALWEKSYTAKDGSERKYYTGSIDVKKLTDSGLTNLYVEENVFKTEDKHPTLRVYIDRPKKDQQGNAQGSNQGSGNSGGGQQSGGGGGGNNPFDDDTL